MWTIKTTVKSPIKIQKLLFLQELLYFATSYLINCYDTILENLWKKNNSVQVWYRAFEYYIAASYSTIWKFVDAIKREQNLNKVWIEQFIAGVGRVAPAVP